MEDRFGKQAAGGRHHRFHAEKSDGCAAGIHYGGTQFTENLATGFRLYRNLNALSDVLKSLAESAGAFGPKDQYEALAADIDGLEAVRTAFGKRVEFLAEAQALEIAQLRQQLIQAKAQKKVVDDNVAAKPKSAPAKSRSQPRRRNLNRSNESEGPTSIGIMTLRLPRKTCNLDAFQPHAGETFLVSRCFYERIALYPLPLRSRQQHPNGRKPKTRNFDKLHMKHADAADLERKIGYTFKKRELLVQALTHSSHAGEHGFTHGRAQAPENLPTINPLTVGTSVAGNTFPRKTMSSSNSWAMRCLDL